MSISLGLQNTKDIYIGSEEVKKIYLGSDLVYQKEEQVIKVIDNGVALYNYINNNPDYLDVIENGSKIIVKQNISNPSGGNFNYTYSTIQFQIDSNITYKKILIDATIYLKGYLKKGSGGGAYGWIGFSLSSLFKISDVNPWSDGVKFYNMENLIGLLYSIYNGYTGGANWDSSITYNYNNQTFNGEDTFNGYIYIGTFGHWNINTMYADSYIKINKLHFII